MKVTDGGGQRAETVQSRSSSCESQTVWFYGSISEGKAEIVAIDRIDRHNDSVAVPRATSQERTEQTEESPSSSVTFVSSCAVGPVWPAPAAAASNEQMAFLALYFARRPRYLHPLS